MLTAELAKLVEHLRDLRRPVVELLAPGIDSSDATSALRLDVPGSVAQWFAWCNGVEIRPGQRQDDVSVIPGYSPVSINEAISSMPLYPDDAILGDHWVPLLASAGGDMYAATWQPDAEATVAGILVGEQTEIEFSSIEQMVTVFNRCFQDGAFYVNDEGILTMSPSRYDAIYQRIVAA